MSAALPRLPRRVSPEVFYLQYLPSVWQAVLGDHELSWPDTDIWLEICVDEAFYTLGVGPKGFVVTNAPESRAHVRVSCDTEAWSNSLGLLWPRVIELLEADGARARNTMQAICYTVNPGFMSTLVKFPGTVMLHYTDDAGDSFDYRFTIGRSPAPSAAVHVKDDDFQRIAEADNVAAAVLQSKLRIDGDAGYVFALAQALTG